MLKLRPSSTEIFVVIPKQRRVNCDLILSAIAACCSSMRWIRYAAITRNDKRTAALVAAKTYDLFSLYNCRFSRLIELLFNHSWTSLPNCAASSRSWVRYPDDQLANLPLFATLLSDYCCVSGVKSKRVSQRRNQCPFFYSSLPRCRYHCGKLESVLPFGFENRRGL